MRCLVLALAGALLASGATFAADTYEVDPVHSTVHFKIRHLGVSNFYGRFNVVGGKVLLDDQDPSRTELEVRVEPQSIDTGNEKRDQHLKSPDFLNARQFPEIAFKSRKVEKLGDGRFRATGDLTLHGVTKEVAVEFARIGTGQGPKGETRTGGEARFTIKRSDFGMTGFPPPALGDEVEVIASLEAIKKE